MLLEEKLRHYAPAIGLPGPRRRAPGGDLDQVLEGGILQTALGSCYLVKRRFPLQHCHGRIPLGAARRISPRTVALLAKGPCPGEAGLERAAFLDLETTGLAGGTGTYAFLVGVGFFDQDEFVVHQYLMRDYAEEPALLEAVAERLANSPVVLTFNGKSFDLPLLETRYLLARRQPPVSAQLHLDLLHPARRLWRGRLESCRLSQVETLFGHQRSDDVPSWMIPSLYFAFVRRGEVEPLRQVFEHNLQDLLSLAALAAHLSQALEQPDGESWSAEEVYGVARMLEERGERSQAAAAYARAWTLAPAQRVGQAAAASLAALHKRAGRPELAVPIWERLAASGSELSLPARVELAKYYEHRARDRTVALRHTLRALDLLEVLELIGTPASVLQQERLALEHRLGRLMRGARIAAGP